jgi:site-specific DNA recombinase
MIAAAYCRYSSSNQREASIDDQIRHAKKICQEHGFADPIIYQDSSISGQRQDRPAYSALLADAESGKFNVLVLWDIKRLSRAEDLPQIIACLQFWGIRIITCDGYDSQQEGSEMRAWLEGLMGNRYLKDLAKSTHRGLTGQALAGHRAGGKPYGYRCVAAGDDGRTLEIDQEQARWVVFIFEQYANGLSCRQIANELNSRRVPSPRGGAWSMSAINGDLKRGIGMLCNSVYIGKWIWNRSEWIKNPRTGRRKRVERPEKDWTITDHPELRIIDQGLWDRARERLLAVKADTAKLRAKNPRAAGNPRPRHLLSGIIQCGVCGSNYVMVNADSYGCSGHKDKGKSFCPNSKQVRRDVAEDVLLSEIRDEMLSEENFKAFERETRRLLKQYQPDQAGARAEVAKAKQEVDNLVKALRMGIITPSTKEALQQAENGLAAARQKMEDAEAFQPTQILPRAREIYRRAVDNLSQISDIALARNEIRAILGEVKLVPEGGILMAEIRGGMSALIKKTLVAGAGFESYLTTYRIPLIKRGDYKA